MESVSFYLIRSFCEFCSEQCHTIGQTKINKDAIIFGLLAHDLNFSILDICNHEHALQNF